MRLSVRLGQKDDENRLSEQQICASVEVMLVRCRATLALHPMHQELVRDILSLERLIDETRNPKPRSSLVHLADDEFPVAPRKNKQKPKVRKELVKELMEPDPPVMGRLGKATPIIEEVLTQEAV